MTGNSGTTSGTVVRRTLVAGLLLAAVVAWSLLPVHTSVPETARETAPVTGLPWQIERLPEGRSRVFGLTLGVDTLDDARARFGHDVQAALLIAADGVTISLEAYYDAVKAGFVTGKMVLTLELSPAVREALLQGKRKADYLESGARRVRLKPDDLANIGRARIGAISFIPAAQLDEQIVSERFGLAAERIRVSGHVEHFLYPELGLDLVLDQKGKELLQYVAPREFAVRLRAPLMEPRSEPSASSQPDLIRPTL